MKTKIPDAVLAAEVSRRGLVKTTAIGGLAMASSALTLPFSRIAHAVDSAIPTKSDEKVIWSACTVNCGSRCPLRMHVVDGEIKYVETDNTGDDNYDGLHQVRACLRGRSMRRRVYNPDRLKYPMKRVGARGEGKFERISWEEAYDIIATKMQRLIKEYGNESIYLNYGTGTLGGTMTRSWPPPNHLLPARICAPKSSRTSPAPPNREKRRLTEADNYQQYVPVPPYVGSATRRHLCQKQPQLARQACRRLPP